MRKMLLTVVFVLGLMSSMLMGCDGNRRSVHYRRPQIRPTIHRPIRPAPMIRRPVHPIRRHPAPMIRRPVPMGRHRSGKIVPSRRPVRPIHRSGKIVPSRR